MTVSHICDIILQIVKTNIELLIFFFYINHTKLLRKFAVSP